MINCKICGKPAQFICSICSTSHYCSTECQANDWPSHRLECQPTNTQPDSTADDLKYYLEQIYLIIKPVLLCIVISILWVKLTNPIEPYYGVNLLNVPSNGGGFSVVDTSNYQASLVQALIILSQIVVATVVVLVLFKYGWIKTLMGILAMIVLALLGLFGYLLGYQLLVVANVALDYISFFFFLWNLVVVGFLAIFWKAPMRLQQAYLVIISSMMAYSFTQLPDLTTWILLVLLAIWDLIAVLCPYGPLRLLVQSSRDQNREIPALLYSVMIWMMAEKIIPQKSSDPLIEEAGPSNAPVQQEEDEEQEKSGLKLGLGDFVFYSVLIARAALFDWTTTINCTVAVMTGLNMTIFLLAIYQKALPALPISIAFGVLFYFVSSIMLTPFVNQLHNLSDVQSDGLIVGKGGAGLVHV